MTLTKQDKAVLRELASQVAELAARDENGRTRDLWRALNGGRHERPMVLIDQVCWNEMDVDGSLACRVEEPYWRDVEQSLRHALYEARHMPTDRVTNPYVTLPRAAHSTGWGLEAELSSLKTDQTSDIASSHMHNQIHGFDDLERIHAPRLWVDGQAEAAIREAADGVFGGVLPYRLAGWTPHLGLWDTVSFWMGVENCYVELLDRPELMHALMERLTEGTLSQIDQMDALGLHDTSSHLCHCSHTFADDLPGPGHDPARPLARDAWAFGMAQLFTAVSPAVTEAFEAAYMRRIFPRFGAIYYGCCERLDDRLDIVATLPNVRKISCSPWSDKEAFAERMPAGRVMSCKPSPALLATASFDEAQARQDLRESIGAARRHGRALEFILKDLSTVRRDPERLWRWARIAMEEVCR